MFPKPRKTKIKLNAKKYGNKTCKCINGHIHDSRGEASYCDQLHFMKKAGEIKDYKIQVKYTFYVNDKKICNHYVDFEVITKNDILEVHEYKGFRNNVWNIKKKLFEACYENIPYIVIENK